MTRLKARSKNFYEEGLAADPEEVKTPEEDNDTVILVEPEEADEDVNEMELERREILVNPSDLQDPGDPEAGDVGVPGGLGDFNPFFNTL